MGAPMNDATQTLADQHNLTVDYGQSLQQMIAAGRYDWSNPKISGRRRSFAEGFGHSPP